MRARAPAAYKSRRLLKVVTLSGKSMLSLPWTRCAQQLAAAAAPVPLPVPVPVAVLGRASGA